MRILVIEDDRDVLSYIEKGLKQEGHTIDTAETGKDGLFLATTETYDVIVVDRMLPELDGLTIIKMIRGADKDTPVLILSAMGEVDDRVQGLRMGGDDYLVKPFAFTELLACIEVLAKRRNNDVTVRQTKIRVGDLEMDLLARKVVRAGRVLDLQSREFRLL